MSPEYPEMHTNQSNQLLIICYLTRIIGQFIMQIKLAHFLPIALLTLLGHVEGVDEVVVLVGERPVAGPQHRAQHREDVGVLDTAAQSSHCSPTRAGHEPLRNLKFHDYREGSFPG